LKIIKKGICLSGILILSALVSGCVFTAVQLHTLNLPDPPEPAIKSGAFPFRLVYELNGEQIVIEDTIVCEYSGVEVIGVGKKSRTWKANFLSTGEEVTYMGVELMRNAETAVYMSVGGPDYYMGEWEGTDYEQKEDFETTFRTDPVEGYVEIIFTEQALFDEYNIKIVEWTHAPPIENSFQ
jgi:hypothetical protein